MKRGTNGNKSDLHPGGWRGFLSRRLCSVLAGVSRNRPQVSFKAEIPGCKRNFGEGEPSFSIRFKTSESLWRVLVLGTLGFGEEYMRGNIEVEGDLQNLVALAFDPSWRSLTHFPIVRIAQFGSGLTRMANMVNSRRNVAHHYDLDNNFFSKWLDDSMAYSCAYYEHSDDDLRAAQLNKYRHICRKLRLMRGEKLVDIGCGWGGMMFYAADRRGAYCTGYTLSAEQYEYVKREIARRDLTGRVEVHLDDYRNSTGKFDKFVSIGMFEHVGRRYFDVYFRKVFQLLKPGGIGLLHTIGSADGKPINPWLEKYIFPGAQLPTLAQITERMAAHNLWVYDIEDLRIHYARTLDEWAARFENVADKSDMDEAFVRMWRLYLNGCSAAFKLGENHLYQTIFSTEKAQQIPLTRAYIYGRETLQPHASLSASMR